MAKMKFQSSQNNTYALVINADDTYHNRFAPDRKHNKGDKKFKTLKKKCSKCGTTSGQLDIHHKDGNRDNNNRSNLTYMCRSCHRSKHDNANYERIISSAARIISDPNTEASHKVAKAHKNDDLMHVEFILCHNDINTNKDHFESADMLESAFTAINKPINWEHSTKNIGTIYDSKFLSVADLTDDQKKYYGKVDPLKKDFIVCNAAIWEYKHPEEARIMRSRNDSDLLFFSMENKFGSAKCSKCNEVYSSVYEYCDHLLNRRSSNSNDHRTFVDSNYIGAGVVGGPADKGAKPLALAYEEDKAVLYGLGLITKEQYIDYMIAGEKMRSGIKIPKEYEVGDNLDNQFYADDENKHFPLDSGDNVRATAEVLINHSDATENYEENEIIYMLERTAKAAKEYNIDLNDIVKGGTSIVEKDIRQTPEFQAELEKGLKEAVAKLKNGEKIQELTDNVDKAVKAIAKMENKLQEETDKTAEAEKRLQDYKDSSKAEELARERMLELEEQGFKFSKESKAIVFSCAASLEDAGFKSFVGLLIEIKDTAIAVHGEKEDKEDKEDKDKKKKKKGIVEESKSSEIGIASIEEEEDSSLDGKLSKVFEAIGQRNFKHLYAKKEG